MNTISKKEFLLLLDEYIPEDAKIVGASAMAGECFEIDEDSLAQIFAITEEVEEEYLGAEESSLILVSV